MPSLDEFREMLGRQQIAATQDPDFPLNQLRNNKTRSNGLKMSAQEFAELQHDLAEYAANPNKITSVLNNKDVPEEVKQKTIDKQRLLISEIQRNKQVANNGARNPKMPIESRDEQRILNLAQRAGFQISDEIKYVKRPQKEELVNLNSNSDKAAKDPFGKNSALDALQPPSDSDEDIEIVVI
jgi:hypothetical protein